MGRRATLLCLAVLASAFDEQTGFGGLPSDSVALLREALAGRANGEDRSPEKTQDQWTSSAALRADFAKNFDGLSDWTVLEVGAYFGYTTRLLSQHFRRVISLDAMPEFLRVNQEYNADRDNILFLRFHTLRDDWGLFASNLIQVVILDASHDYEAVRSDVENCLALPSVNFIVFDDYGAEMGVRAAVHEYVSRGLLRPVMFLGEGASGPWQLRDGRTIEEREAITCEVLRSSDATPACVFSSRGTGYAEPGSSNRRCGTCCGATDTTSPMCSGSTGDGRLRISEDEVQARCSVDDTCVGYSKFIADGSLYFRPVSSIDRVVSDAMEWETYEKTCAGTGASFAAA